MQARETQCDGALPAAAATDADPPGIPDSALESVTELIAQAQNKQAIRWDRIYSVLYQELHALAQQQIRKHWSGPARSSTSLVSRAWLRLSQSPLVYQNRDHLVGVLARAMRYALIDEIRQSHAAKRRDVGGDAILSSRPDAEAEYDPELERMLAIHQALELLAESEPRLGQVVEMRYFAGMTDAEIAEILSITPRTVHRDWVRARAFLSSVLGDTALYDDAE
ncbi:ECF-type sigma factor [Lysobacter silvisoli]|nr:ECF-type sigma factor [Lysobacter silvisoli]